MQKNNENREIVQIKRFITKKAIREEPVLTKLWSMYGGLVLTIQPNLHWYTLQD